MVLIKATATNAAPVIALGMPIRATMPTCRMSANPKAPSCLSDAARSQVAGA